MNRFWSVVAILAALASTLEVVQAQSGAGSDVIDDEGIVSAKTHKECRILLGAECKYNGKRYGFFEDWVTDECHRCTCYDDAVICCDILQLPIDWHPKCKPRINKQQCRVDMVVLDKPWLPCAHMGPIGRGKHGHRRLKLHRIKPVVIAV